MSTPDLSNPTFDVAAFLGHAGLGRRIVEIKEKEHFFSQGDPAGLRVLPSKRPGQADRRFAIGQRGYHHSALYGGLRWRECAGGRAWASLVYGYRNHPMRKRSRLRGKR